MTKTALRKARTTAKVHGLKAVGDPADGIFEAYVAIFGNVDHHGDRIHPGAFAASLERWKASGDPIPVIFSHQWDDLDAHIGEVLEAEEHAPGDARLPAELKANGGLWTRFRLELDEDFAARVAKKLEKRTIREFSFAYDVFDESRDPDGANGLHELDVLEVGPTLKGANPATVLLSDALEGPGAAAVVELLRAGAKAVAHAFSPNPDEPTRCVLCGLTRNTNGHFTSAAPADGAKAMVSIDFDGSVEAELDAVALAALEWAEGLDLEPVGGLYSAALEATFPAEGRAIVRVEGWSDPLGGGVFYEVNYAVDDEGAVELSDPHEIVVEVTTTRKGRGRVLWSAKAIAAGATVPTEPKHGKADGNGGDPGGPETEDRAEEQHDEGAPIEAALVDLELDELELST